MTRRASGALLRRLVGPLAVVLTLGPLGAAVPAHADDGHRPTPVASTEIAAAERAARTSRYGGFVPVVELPGLPSSGVSPATGELWLTGTDPASGAPTLGHLRDGTWTVTTLPAGSSGSRVDPQLAATSARNVWLATGSALSRWDGTAWNPVALPSLADAAAYAIAVRDSSTAYVAIASPDLYGEDGGDTHIFRWTSGRWTDLGAPQWMLGVNQLVATSTGVSTLYQNQGGWTVADYVGGHWRDPDPVGSVHYTNNSYGGLFVTSGGTHYLFGGSGIGGFWPICQRWKPTGGANPAPEELPTPTNTACTTHVMTGPVNPGRPIAPAVARLRDGSFVLGGQDFLTPTGFDPAAASSKVQGTFALHRPDGSEATLAGDPGVRTQLMVGDPSGKGAWAVTVDGAGTALLQRWDAKA